MIENMKSHHEQKVQYFLIWAPYNGINGLKSGPNSLGFNRNTNIRCTRLEVVILGASFLIFTISDLISFKTFFFLVFELI